MTASALLKLDDETLDVLAQATITGPKLVLNGQLSRPLYVKVDKALQTLGGKWDRKAKAHVFEDDPGAVIAAALEDGAVLDKVKAFQFYPTPPEVADHLVSMAFESVGGPCQRVLEPSAGAGALIKALQNLPGEVQAKIQQPVDCFELDEMKHAQLRNTLTDVNILGLDFMAAEPRPIYSIIIANPPFTRGQDVAHVSRMLDWLAPGCTLATIMSAGVRFRTDKATTALKAKLAETCWSHTFFDLPEGSFKAAGTAVRTVILLAYKKG